MKFEAGKPRPPNAGRKKGSVNKKSLLVKDVLESHGINLVEQIVIRLKEISREDQVKALTALLPYVYPKLASIEVKAEVGGFAIRDLSRKTDDDLEAILIERDHESTGG